MPPEEAPRPKTFDQLESQLEQNPAIVDIGRWTIGELPNTKKGDRFARVSVKPGHTLVELTGWTKEELRQVGLFELDPVEENGMIDYIFKLS
jgi:hypothetical protein